MASGYYAFIARNTIMVHPTYRYSYEHFRSDIDSIIGAMVTGTKELLDTTTIVDDDRRNAIITKYSQFVEKITGLDIESVCENDRSVVMFDIECEGYGLLYEGRKLKEKYS